jgi:hypothetical protein
LYQTIYLNTHDVPAELKTVAVDRWRQVACSVPHLEHCTLQLKRVQGPHVFFAGSYVLVNSHEVAIMSGIRAAQLCLGEKSFPTTLWGTENEAFVALKTFY